MLRSDIIQQLTGDERFPALDVSFPIDVRMSVYRSDIDWALILESFEFNQQRLGHDGIITEMWCYGNSLPQAPGRYYPELHVTADGPGGSLFDLYQYDNSISPLAKDLRLRDKVAPVTLDPAAYAAAGIELKRPPRIFGYELLRLIAPQHRRILFATEGEIVQRIGESMPLLLRLDEWRHPDRGSESPADLESFQMIADVIAHNDPSLYQPTEPPNTHWSNWPLAGVI
jgi:uncharacterized protein DUF7003